MEIYTVTFCALDQDVDANLLWHSCLLLSCYDAKTKKMEVLEDWDFKGVPATSKLALWRDLKRYFKLDTDFYGNHGILDHEETRRLERGCGLHGVTFELSKEKFELLQKRCATMFNDQEMAIQDAVRDLQLKPLPPGQFRNYPYEHESYRIYQYELNRAKSENRAPRLYEFSLNVLTGAKTCKTQILPLLDGVITPEQLARLTGLSTDVTRFSGKMEDIYLHSQGALSTHTKQSGEVVHYHKIQDAKIYWTFPPQEMEMLSQKNAHLFKVYADQSDVVKSVIKKLQGLEWCFRDLVLDAQYECNRNLFLDEIIKLYEQFAVIEPKQTTIARNDWSSFWQYLASQPRDVDEKRLLDKITQATQFINNLYMTLVDEFELETYSANLDKKNDYTAFLLSLTEAQRKNICSIIGRSYVSPEQEEELDSFTPVQQLRV